MKPEYMTRNSYLMDSFRVMFGIHLVIVIISGLQIFLCKIYSLSRKALDLAIVFCYFGSIFKCQINYVDDESLISQWILTELISFYTQIMVAILLLVIGTCRKSKNFFDFDEYFKETST